MKENDRYFEGQPLFPFGHGLLYTTFAYSELALPDEIDAGDDVEVTVLVTNTGTRAGDEVVQLYVSIVEASDPAPIRSLAGFRRVSLEPGESREVTFKVSARAISFIDSQNRGVVGPGTIEVSVGGKQPGFLGAADASTTGVAIGRITVSGRAAILDP